MQSARGLTELDAPTRDMLRRLRRQPPQRDQRHARLAWLIAAAMHGLFVVAIWQLMRPAPAQRPPLRQVGALQIRFIARAPDARTQPPPALPPLPATPGRRPRAPNAAPATDAVMTLSLPTAANQPLHPPLFDQLGRVILPAAATSSAPPAYVQRRPQGDRQIMQHADPIEYQATRFEPYFPPPDESAGGAAVRHAVDAVVGTTAVDLPHGTHLKCVTILGIPIPNCVNPAPPPSAKDGDERLSMAPAASLDGARHGPKPPSVKACIAMYRAGKPLQWGCPVDTPARAVDAELRARAKANASGQGR